MDAVELHCWNSTVDALEEPDVVVFDLDPGTGMEYEFVREAALEFREVLSELGLLSWPKLTGGKGIHVVAPIAGAGMSHNEAHKFAKGVAQVIAAKHPARTTQPTTLPTGGAIASGIQPVGTLAILTPGSTSSRRSSPRNAWNPY
jgi:DNA primase